MKSRRRKQSSSLGPVVMIIAGVLVIGAVLIWAGLRNSSGQQGFGDGTTNGVERVSLQDSRAALDAGNAVFLDVRGADQFASGHIPGAVNIPLNELDARLNELDPNAWIITYCT